MAMPADDTRAPRDDQRSGLPVPGPAALPARIGLSLGALALIVVHVLWPDAGVDVITVALLVLVAVPWLLPWLQQSLQSIEIGGVKLVLQELRRVEQQVERLSEQVERAFEFAGEPVPEAVKDRLDERLSAFGGHLRALGIVWEGNLPRVVHMGADFPYLGLYDPEANELRLSAQADELVALRELCYYALHRPLYEQVPTLAAAISDVPAAGPEFEAAAILSAVTTYLARDFAGIESGPEWLPNPGPGGTSQQQRVFAVEYAGAQWVAALWSLRERHDPPAIAAAVAGAWRAVVYAPVGRAERFAATLVATLAAEAHTFDHALEETRQFSVHSSP